MQLPSLQGLGPADTPSSKGKPEFSRHFDHVRGCSAGVPGTRYALSHTEGRNAYLDRVALGAGGQLLQRKAHRGGEHRAGYFSLSLRGSGPFAQGRSASGFINAPFDCHGSIPLSLNDGETSYLRALGIYCGSGKPRNPAMPTLVQPTQRRLDAGMMLCRRLPGGALGLLLPNSPRGPVPGGRLDGRGLRLMPVRHRRG